MPLYNLDVSNVSEGSGRQSARVLSDSEFKKRSQERYEAYLKIISEVDAVLPGSTANGNAGIMLLLCCH